MTGCGDFIIFHASVFPWCFDLGWGKQMPEEVAGVSEEERASDHVFALGHVKLEAPGVLGRKIWINIFWVGLNILQT